MGTHFLVKNVKEPIDWTVEVPGSKSMTNRALLLAALSDGTVELSGVLFSDDSRHFLSCLTALGFAVECDEEKKCAAVCGCGGKIPKKQAVINVGSAGTAARFLTALLGFSDGVYTIDASEQMKKRPMRELFSLLSAAGAEITCLEEEGHLPVRVRGAGCGAAAEGKPAEFSLDISASTQFLSALLLISPIIRQGLAVRITSEKKDGSYISITRNMMREFGVPVSFDGECYRVERGAVYRKKSYAVEPDMSAACYFYGAAAITGGTALVRQVHPDNTQGDRKFLAVLAQMGCEVRDTADGIAVRGPAQGKLRGISLDMNDFSDQALTLAAPGAHREYRAYQRTGVRPHPRDCSGAFEGRHQGGRGAGRRDDLSGMAAVLCHRNVRGSPCGDGIFAAGASGGGDFDCGPGLLREDLRKLF